MSLWTDLPEKIRFIPCGKIRGSWWICHLESWFWHYRFFFSSSPEISVLWALFPWEVAAGSWSKRPQALSWAHPEPLFLCQCSEGPSAARIQENFSVQAPTYLIPSFLLPFTACFQYGFFTADLSFSAALQLRNTPEDKKNLCETGNSLFFISDGVSGLIMNFECLYWLLTPFGGKTPML